MSYQGLYQGLYEGAYQGASIGPAPPDVLPGLNVGTVVALTGTLIAGDLEPDLYLQVKLNGVPRDLADITSVAMRWRQPNGTLRVVPLEVYEEGTGLLRYVWLSGDTNIAGHHKAQVILTYASGEHTTYPTDGTPAIWYIGEVLS